ncbi:MAG: RlmE family RNA methyltransferase, partial [Alphaproteobacteria bacterium]|nr:RlmE family RNA methyltransferase [Alphaproteobacteria bacterium]
SEAVGRNTPPYIIGIDLLPLDPVPPAYIMTGDFTKAEIQDKLVRQLQGKKCDGVLSDMASNTTGHQGTDHLRTLLLAEVAFDFACQHLGKGGFFVCKVFQGGAGGELLTAMKKKFRRVDHIKPSASRKESPELYLVARGFRG